MQFRTVFSPWRLATVALAAAGAGLFWWLGLPLPLLLGPMFACLVAALAGMPLRGVPPVSEAMRVVIGVAVGASLTPAGEQQFRTHFPDHARLVAQVASVLSPGEQIQLAALLRKLGHGIQAP